jgi:hypothetical protein
MNAPFTISNDGTDWKHYHVWTWDGDFLRYYRDGRLKRVHGPAMAERLRYLLDK